MFVKVKDTFSSHFSPNVVVERGNSKLSYDILTPHFQGLENQWWDNKRISTTSFEWRAFKVNRLSNFVRLQSWPGNLILSLVLTPTNCTIVLILPRRLKESITQKG